jgi:hypothetical protein
LLPQALTEAGCPPQRQPPSQEIEIITRAHRQTFNVGILSFMSIYTKSPSQVVSADLQELINEGAAENARLEFKQLVPGREDTLKKLSSFANTFGGYMVIGAKAESKDGRLQELPGVDLQNGYKQKVVQWCFEGASPPLLVEVSDPISVPSANGKVCYVIYTPESDIAPHFLNSRKGVWVRTDEFSAKFEAQLAAENELRHLLDRRQLIRERRTRLLQRAKKRFDVYASKLHTDHVGNRTKSGPMFELSVVPRFPARELCGEEELQKHIRSTCMSWRQVTFPDSGKPILLQHESALVLSPMRGTSIFEANVWGLVFYATHLETEHNENSGIHLYQLVGYMLLFVRHAAKMLGAMGYSGPISIQTSLTSVRDVSLLHADRFFYVLLPTPGSELDDDVSFSTPATTADLLEKPDGITIEVLRRVLFSVNAFDLIDTPEKLEHTIRSGHNYNYWSSSGQLQV